MIRFVIKAAFWLSVVVMCVPLPHDAPKEAGEGVSTIDAIAALSTAVADIKGFCGRNPESCVTGAAAFQGFGYKAEHSARLLHEFISAKLHESRDLKVPKVAGPGPKTPSSRS